MRIPFPLSFTVGTDIVLRSRIARFSSSGTARWQRFATKVLHPLELRQLSSRFPDWRDVHRQSAAAQDRVSSWLAGRWAAKEAAKKAWGASILNFRDLRVEVGGDGGEVQVVCDVIVSSSNQRIEQVAKLSITHDGEYAVAVVIATPLHPTITTELGRRKADAVSALRHSIDSELLDLKLQNIHLQFHSQVLVDTTHNIAVETNPIIMGDNTRKLFKNQGYEQDPRAAAVDAYTTAHLSSRNPFHDALAKAYDHTLASGLPDISCSPTQGKFLAIQLQISGAKNVLEVGTLGGYSGIWLASAGSDVKVTSVEIDPRHKQIAEENFQRAGVSDRVEVLLGPGIEVLPRLVEEVKAGKREKFDFVFIDADKINNLAYFNLSLEMVKQRTCIYVDNIVRKGKLVDETCIKAEETGVVGARKLIEAVGQDDRVAAVVIQTLSEKNYDGFLMAVVK